MPSFTLRVNGRTVSVNTWDSAQPLLYALRGPLVPRLRRSPLAGAVLDGVNVASLALMAVVTWHLGRSALLDPITLALCAGSLVALVLFRVNSTWLIAAGAVTGWTVGA